MGFCVAHKIDRSWHNAHCHTKPHNIINLKASFAQITFCMAKRKHKKRINFDGKKEAHACHGLLSFYVMIIIWEWSSFTLTFISAIYSSVLFFSVSFSYSLNGWCVNTISALHRKGRHRAFCTRIRIKWLLLLQWAIKFLEQP